MCLRFLCQAECVEYGFFSAFIYIHWSYVCATVAVTKSHDREAAHYINSDSRVSADKH